MTAIQDTLAGLIAYLKADTDVSAEVGTRVFGDELPRSLVEAWQAADRTVVEKTIVIRPGGGSVPTWAQGSVPLDVPRYDILCYGAGPYEAHEVRRAAAGALRALERSAQGTVLLHWARPAGGHASLRDPDTDWPVAWQSWQVMADERAIA